MAVKSNRTPRDPRRQLASVMAVLEQPLVQELVRRHSRILVTEAVRVVLARRRNALLPDDTPPVMATLVQDVEQELSTGERDRTRPVVNATGIILHTGLGRAVLCSDAARALTDLNGCCNLQIDIETGRRGKRNHMCETLLCTLTGAEAAVIVNNNAAATLLILSALCQDREVIVSRGQLVEIGHCFDKYAHLKA